MIRYRTRDLTRLLPGSARTMRRMDKITGRSDDMMIIRGVNVFPTQIEEHILALGPLSPHYLIELERRGNLDHMTVNVELAPSATESGDDVAGALQQRIKAHVGVSCQVNIRDTGGVARSEGKAKRVIDHRKE